MRKKKVVVSNSPGRLSGGAAGRALRLSRETIRTLNLDELSQAGGGALAQCPTTTSTTKWDPDV